MLKNLALSLLLGKSIAFSPIHFHAPKQIRNQVCRNFYGGNIDFHNRYLDLLGPSPYQKQISNLFSQDKLSIEDNSTMHIYVNKAEDDWLKQFEVKKDRILSHISGDKDHIEDLSNLLRDSVSHSLEALSSQIEIAENLPVRISIRIEKPKEQVLLKPSWHPDGVSFHLLVNLLSDHCTLYHGPANVGEAAAEYYGMNDKHLSHGKIIEAPLGEYVFSSQGAKPVYHASPIKTHHGRLALVLQIGPTPPDELMMEEVARGLRL